MNTMSKSASGELELIKKIEDMENEIEQLKNKNVQLQNEIDEKMPHAETVTVSAGGTKEQTFPLTTPIKNWQTRNIVASVVGGQLATIQTVLPISSNEVRVSFESALVSGRYIQVAFVYY